MRNVFISYTRDDQAAAQLIASRLAEAGESVFFDIEGIVAGDSWNERISDALRSASIVLVLLSSNSRRSTYVQDEVQLALKSKKLVIPVLLDKGAKQNWLWPLLATRQSIELDLRSDQLESQLSTLVGRLSTLRAVDRSVPPSAIGAEAPRALRMSNRWKSVALAVASAAVGALLMWLLR